MTALGLLLAAIGLLFVWSAIRGKDPRKLVADIVQR